jgi:hypothetical protein
MAPTLAPTSEHLDRGRGTRKSAPFAEATSMITSSRLPYAPPSTATRTSGRRVVLNALGAIGLSAVLGIGTCVAVGAEAVANGREAFDPVCRQYLRQVAAGDDHAAYGELDPSMQATVTEAELARLNAWFHTQEGDLRTAKVASVQQGFDNAVRWGQIVYACELEKGRATIRFDLRKRSAGWKIVGVHYDSRL